jgi:hypothetical protein
MYRVFCANAWELEAERDAFLELVGQINEAQGMPRGILLVPVTLVNVDDKRRFQRAVDENIRASSYYLLVVEEDWGPRARNFERDYRLAVACAADENLPMRGAAILVRDQPDGAASPFGAVLATAGFPSTRFSTLEEFRSTVSGLLSEWLAAIPAESDASGEVA